MSEQTTEWPIGARVRLPNGEGVGTVVARDGSSVPVQVREDYNGRAVWWTDDELEAAALDPDRGRLVADIIELPNGDHLVIWEDGGRRVVTPAEQEAFRGK